MTLLLRAIFLGLLTFAFGCTTQPPGPHDLTSPFGRNHPLTAKIWDTQARRFISPAELASALSRHDFILLGERHDNLDHHKLQAWLIEAIAGHNRSPVAAFEMIPSDKAEALAIYQENDRHNADGLDVFLDWKTSGWPDWKNYKPLADAALFNGMKLAAANLPPSVVKDMIKGGRAALPPELAHKLNLPGVIPDTLKEALAADIREAHCHTLPENLIPPFVDIQFARDALMAESLKVGGGDKGGILIAGAGHARNDLGVPWHLHRIAPKKSVTALAFIEVEEGELEPSSYAAGWNAAALPFDYVWFTARASRDDPCAALRNKKEKSSGQP